MIKQILMPNAGQTTDTARINKWFVKKGDRVKRGDVLVDVETDKATLDIESFTAGIVIELKYSEGDEVSSGNVLALIGDEEDLSSKDKTIPIPVEEKSVEITVGKPLGGDEINQAVPVEKQSTLPAPSIQPQKSPSSGKDFKAMPNAKKLARERGINISVVSPSNKEYVKVSDVEVHDRKNISTLGSMEYTILPVNNMRSVIGMRMLESVQNIPSFSATIKVDMTEAIALRKSFQEELGIKISFNDLIAKAIAVTARKFTLINARFEDDEVRIYKHTNIGLAVDVEGGLLVPVVRNVDLLGLGEIAATNQKNIEAARTGILLPDSIGGANLTISNLGMYEVSQFTAIINPPESCIFAIGKIETAPTWDEIGELWKPVPMMMITASFDHRLIDGAYGAQILKNIKALIEHPALMLL